MEGGPFKGEEAYSGWRVYNLRPFKEEEANGGWRVYTFGPFEGEEAYTLDPSKGRRGIHMYIYYIYTCSGWLRPFQRGGGLPRIVSQSCTHTVLHKIRSCYEEAY